MLASTYDPNNIAEDVFDRANHTGTQTASTISNFDAAVSSNSAVTANTAKVGITPTQASNITTNNAKISFDSTSSNRLAAITDADYKNSNTTKAQV